MRTSLAAFSALLLIGALAPPSHAAQRTLATPAYWVLGDEDTTIHVLGTMHLMHPEVDWFHGELRKAFDEADELVLESLFLEPAAEQELVMSMALDSSGEGLRSRLDGVERKRYDAAMLGLGLPRDAFDPFEPWIAAVNLALMPALAAGYQVEAGVDQVLEEAAKAASKSMTGLETVREQLGFFDSLDAQLQLDMLNGTVEELPDLLPMIDDMEALWSSGRAAELGRLVQESMKDYDDDGLIAEILLDERNRVWADWVVDRMDRPGEVFLAVGAAHLTGDGNLLERLRSRGFDARRLQYDTAK